MWLRRTILRLAKVVKAPVTDVESLARQMIGIAEVVGSPTYPTDVDALREVAEQSFGRRGDLAAQQRHTAAVAAAGDRRAALAGITAPTLVIHGEVDPMIRPIAGRATAEAIPGARLMVVPAMGHAMPRPLWGGIVEGIVDIAGLPAPAAP